MRTSWRVSVSSVITGVFIILVATVGHLSIARLSFAEQKNAEYREGSEAEVEVSPEAENTPLFVILPRVGNIRRAPSFKAPVVFKLVAGTELSVSAKNDVWYAVHLPDGRSGWAHKSILVNLPENGLMAAEDVKTIHAIRTEIISGQATKILFELSGFYPPETSVIEGAKPRVVCDFVDTRLATGMDLPLTFSNHAIRRVRIGFHETPLSKVRVVLDLVDGPDYAVEQHFLEKENYFILIIKREDPSVQ